MGNQQLGHLRTFFFFCQHDWWCVLRIRIIILIIIMNQRICLSALLLASRHRNTRMMVSAYPNRPAPYPLNNSSPAPKQNIWENFKILTSPITPSYKKYTKAWYPAPQMLLGYMKTLTLAPIDLGGKLDLNLARTTPLLP